MYVLYHLNNNITFHTYDMYEDVTQKQLNSIRNKLKKDNGQECTLNCVVVEGDKVIMIAGKLSKKEKDMLSKVYKFKRGL
jgi:hypothetical protein